MTLDSEILDYIELDLMNNTTKIKDNTPEEKVKKIKEINEIYKESMGEYLWNFVKEGNK